jgi:hypothetical protein
MSFFDPAYFDIAYFSGDYFEEDEGEIVVPVSPPVLETDPQVMLAKSDDGGHSWVSLVDKSLGAVGEYSVRVEWRRLGRSRQRNYQVVITADTAVRIADAYLKVDGGNS